MKKLLITTIGLGLLFGGKMYAQQDTYVAPTGNMVTFTGAQVAIFGNLINDARGTAATASTAQTGVNHTGGGTVYLYRHSVNGSGNSRIYDGPLSTYGTGTDNYNAGGKAVRFYNLITDNNVGTAAASGTVVNGTAGSGQIQMEQEACVSNLLTFTNGIIWTPRGAWKHAFVHFDADAATYTGAGAINTAYSSPATNMQVDGYVAKTGSSAFTFPIGDGVYTRFSGLSSPASGEYKSAFFKKDGHALTTGSGISGSSTQGSTADANAHGGITKVNTTEFWDIDGTGKSQFSLDAFNSGGYSNWNTDFSGVSGATPAKIVITALDAWENLSITSAPSAYTADGTFTTAVSTNPDAGSTFSPASGNPFVAYTWAIAPVSIALPITLSSFTGIGNNCDALISWSTATEANSKSFVLQQSTDGLSFIDASTVKASGNSTGKLYSTSVAQSAATSYYRLKMIDLDGSATYSKQIVIHTNCGGTDYVKVYPNPTGLSNTVYVSFGTTQKGTGLLLLTNNLGQQLINKAITVNSGANVQAIDITNLSSGTYYVRVLSADGQNIISTQKIVKQ